jgi:hypothetical protein
MSSTTPRPPQPWKFVGDGKGGGIWSQYEVAPGSIFPSLVQPADGSHTYGNGIGYWFGGHLIGKTYPSRDWYPVSGLIEYNMTSNVWANISSAGYGKVPHHGLSHFVPSFGSSGLTLFMGGRDSNETALGYYDSLNDFANITLYDPETGKWHHQLASGTVPEGRDRACVVGVQGENNTYEMYVSQVTVYITVVFHRILNTDMFQISLWRNQFSGLWRPISFGG